MTRDATIALTNHNINRGKGRMTLDMTTEGVLTDQNSLDPRSRFLASGNYSDIAPSPSSSNSGNLVSRNPAWFVLAGVLFFLVVAGALIGCCCSCCYRTYKKKKERNRNIARLADDLEERRMVLKNLLDGRSGGLNICRIFRLEDLEKATGNFSSETEIGSGGFGTVYKGTLSDGKVVAIKRTNNAGVNNLEQFLNEVTILSQVNNCNLVKLLGCCIDLEVPLLVYEFVSNGTLQHHLKNRTASLNWNTRFRIAIQTAEALNYLHFQATPPIFHRDVKAANILLDCQFHAKVADFGLSKLVDMGVTHVSTMVKGTPGYLDPEYYHNFQLTDKTDVYSFGVVLMELITSKKPLDLRLPIGDENLAVRSTRMVRSGRTREIIDPNLASAFSEDDFRAVDAVAQIAVACVGPDRKARPSMRQVLEMLQSVKGSTLKTEEFYGDETWSMPRSKSCSYTET